MAIYQGVWYNHAAKQLILTLDVRSGGFLSAAIVTWVNFAAAATWTIWRWALYRSTSTSENDTTVFYQQRQALLRNSSGAAGTVGDLFKLGFSWKGHRIRFLGSSVLQIIACIIIFSIWTVCGLFAPYIYTKAQGDVLIESPPFCGTLDYTNVDYSNMTIVNLFRADDVAYVNEAQAYVQQCYDASSTSKCHDFPRATIPFTTTSLDSCPFGTFDVCMSLNSTPIKFDTGLLDSNLDFGMNVVEHQRVQYRRVTTCSPIQTSPFVTIFNTTGTEEEDQYPPGTVLLRYNYGPDARNNWTFEYSIYQATFPVAYTLSAFQYMPSAGAENAWFVNATLFNATDADFSLVLVQGNHVEYPGPVDDPIFSAGAFPGDKLELPLDNNFIEIYFSSYPSTAMACMEQHQICLPYGDRSCTPLVGSGSILNASVALTGIATDQTALASVERFAAAALDSSIYSVPYLGGASILLASHTLQDLIQTTILPKDQWATEALNWFSISLAQLQARMSSYATGPMNPAIRPYVSNFHDDGTAELCRSQRSAESAGYTNFDMVALIVLAVVGTALIVLGLIFERIMLMLAKRNTHARASYARWLSDGVYHQQHIALKGSGVGGWFDVHDEIPKSHELVRPRAGGEAENVFLLQEVQAKQL
ncbi:hypothetical protein K431DRAFT_301299 [Polychaeton citri CBS 116435]|uniref:Uncharacterized protein n=1 Tax=Polychaeton citri CBS 116435 TaxID=1314669 RepID=A0A9P4QAT6_9PEZI|nr:hypothetical protein K431DRAFT_301299 [Polychaeton citri CBS 116435]